MGAGAGGSRVVDRALDIVADRLGEFRLAAVEGQDPGIGGQAGEFPAQDRAGAARLFAARHKVGGPGVEGRIAGSRRHVGVRRGGRGRGQAQGRRAGIGGAGEGEQEEDAAIHKVKVTTQPPRGQGPAASGSMTDAACVLRGSARAGACAND